MSEQSPATFQFDAASNVPLEFELICELGRGTYGIVYKARHKVLDQLVAIKFFPGELASGGTDAEARFRKELKSIGVLSHPNIVKVLQSGVSGRNTPYIVFEFVEGESLQSLLARPRQSKSLPKEFIEIVFLQLADALTYAHEQGVVHRDLKPANIMICSYESISCLQVKLLDFGIAVLQEEQAIKQSQDKTKTGMLKGSPAYMSPEQCKSQPVDARSDVYALATVLYECLTGRLPFDGDSLYELLYNKLNASPRLPAPELDKGLSLVLVKGLAFDKEDRYPSAGGFVSALMPVLKDLRPMTPGKSGLPLVLFSALVLLFGIVGGAVYFSGKKEVKLKAPAGVSAEKYKPKPVSAEGELRQILEAHEGRLGDQNRENQNRNHEETIKRLTALLPRLSQNRVHRFIALDQTADCQFRMGSWREARGTLQKIKRLLGENFVGVALVEVESRLALMGWKLHDLPDAQVHAKEALRVSAAMNNVESDFVLPDYYRIARRSELLSTSQQILGNCAESGRDYESALNYFEDSEKSLDLAWNGNDLGRPCLSKADLLLKLGRREEAVKHLMKQVETIYAQPPARDSSDISTGSIKTLIEDRDAYNDYLACKAFAYWLQNAAAYHEALSVYQQLSKFCHEQGLNAQAWYKGVDREIDECIENVKKLASASRLPASR